MQQSESDVKQDRKQVFTEIVQAFEEKYSWLGHQTARELLLSAASWNIDQNSNPSFRYRNHIMLAWKRGWLKSSMMGKMAAILGDDLCSTIGKVTDASMRGSVSGGTFTPPKPLKTPIIISTEFGQTDFEDELLNIFLALLEEGKTNISLNKIGNISNAQKKDIEKRYNGRVEFGESNEFDLKTNFVFWGATYDHTKLQDDALRSRFNVVTPEQKLDYEVVKSLDRNRFQLSNSTVKDVRNMLKSQREMKTNFSPPSHFFKEYDLEPRELRDIKSYMASRNWWGLEVNPEVMKRYIEHLKHSRRIANMSPEERVFDLIFDNPMTFDKIVEETGYSEKEVYTYLDKLDPSQIPSPEGIEFVIYSGDKRDAKEDESSGLEGFLEGE